jgi:hypothetical protein
MFEKYSFLDLAFASFLKKLIFLNLFNFNSVTTNKLHLETRPTWPISRLEQERDKIQQIFFRDA